MLKLAQARKGDLLVLMTQVDTELDATIRLAVAALIGLGVGLEREWSGHAAGPNARFAGLRTFLLLGVVGGVAGLLLSLGYGAAAAAVIAGGMALGVAAYVVTARRPHAGVDGTTEAAALAVVALGALTGWGWIALSVGAGSIIVLALSEKTRLHWLVRRVSEPELHAALQFAVLALVVLPLLPSGSFGGPLAIQPRTLWTLVLFFSALNFVGFLARRAVGPTAGYTLAGLLGGLVSSTAVTLDFSRTSRQEKSVGASLGYGVIGACTVLIPRIIVVSSVLNPAVGIRLCWLLWIPALCGTIIVFIGWRAERGTDHEVEAGSQSPLRLRSAIQMAVAFQFALTAVPLVRQHWGTLALYPSAGVLGLTDMDALTVSMSKLDQGVAADVAAFAIAIGVLANTILKFGVAAGIGLGRFRRIALIGLAILGAASAAGMLLSIPGQ
jgi:uncharacterized membrane protein (DUF4010 family)